MFSSHDGRFVYISRPEHGRRRGDRDRERQDRLALPDGGLPRRPHGDLARRHAAAGLGLDGAQGARARHATGAKVGEFESGDSPHESNYSADGSKIFHASIGMVYTPADQPVADSTKGDRWFQVVDAKSYKVAQAARHRPDPRRQRPRGLLLGRAPDGDRARRADRLHAALVPARLRRVRPRRRTSRCGSRTCRSARRRRARRARTTCSTPRTTAWRSTTRARSCARPGTMSDYAAIVHRDDFSHKIVANGGKPYWATNSADGRYCFVSFSGDDEVSVLDYASEREVAGSRSATTRSGCGWGSCARTRSAGCRPSPAAGSATRRAQAGEAADRPRARRARQARRAARHDLARDRPAARRLPLQRPPHALLDPDPEAHRARRSRGRSAARCRAPSAASRPASSRSPTRADARVRPDRLRSRVATRRARLRRTLTMIDAQGRLVARGTVEPRRARRRAAALRRRRRVDASCTTTRRSSAAPGGCASRCRRRPRRRAASSRSSTRAPRAAASAASRSRRPSAAAGREVNCAGWGGGSDPRRRSLAAPQRGALVLLSTSHRTRSGAETLGAHAR